MVFAGRGDGAEWCTFATEGGCGYAGTTAVHSEGIDSCTHAPPSAPVHSSCRDPSKVERPNEVLHVVCRATLLCSFCALWVPSSMMNSTLWRARSEVVPAWLRLPVAALMLLALQVGQQCRHSHR